MSRDYKKQVKARNAKMAAKGRSDRMVIPQEVEMDNFQDPQISSSRPLVSIFFSFKGFWMRLMIMCRRWGGFGGFEWAGPSTFRASYDAPCFDCFFVVVVSARCRFLCFFFIRSALHWFLTYNIAFVHTYC